MEKLPGDYIAGFVDGEGCFALKYRLDKQKNANGRIRSYYYWTAEFVIVLRSDDLGLLYKIQQTLDCGKVTYNNKFARLSVQNNNELQNLIIPFFNQYRLVGKKSYDFKLWERGVGLIAKYRSNHLNITKGTRGFLKNQISIADQSILHELRNQMLVYKSHRPNEYKYSIH